MDNSQTIISKAFRNQLYEKTALALHLSRPRTAGTTRKAPTQLQNDAKSQISGIKRPTSASTYRLLSKSSLLSRQPTTQSTRKTTIQSTKRPATSQPVTQSQQKLGAKSMDKPIAIDLKKAPQRPISLHCGICLDLLVLSRIHTMKPCGVKFHFNCVKDYVRAISNSQDLPFICPAEGCKHRLTEKDFLSGFFSGEEFRIVQKKLKIRDAMENPDKFTICSTPDCQHIFSIPENNSIARVTCPLCKRATCLNCKVSFHVNLTCEEYNTTNPDELAVFNDFIGKRWMRCSKCLFWIERNEGCNHMTCKCGFQFCYVCGEKWRDCKC